MPGSSYWNARYLKVYWETVEIAMPTIKHQSVIFNALISSTVELNWPVDIMIIEATIVFIGLM